MKDSTRSLLRGLFPGLIIALSAVVYFYRIGDKPLDFDERYSVNIALGTGGPITHYDAFGRFASNPLPGPVFHSDSYTSRQCLHNMVDAAMNDNGQGIPYFFLQHYWFQWFGITAVTARSLSALLMICSLILLFFFFRRIALGTWISLFVLAVFAGNGVIIGLAQYARFYSLGILMCIASLHLLWALCRRSSPKLQQAPNNTLLLALGLLWGLFFLNQYLSALVILPEFIFLLLLLKPRFSTANFCALAAGALLPVLIWLLPLQGWESLRNIYLLHAGGHMVPPELTTSTSGLNLAIAWASSLAGALGQPLNYLQGPGASFIHLIPSFPILLLCILMLFKPQKSVWQKLSFGVLFSFSLASVLHSLITGHTLLFQVRYWVFGYVFAMLWLALGWPSWQEASRLLKLLCVLVAFCGLSRVAYASISACTGLELSARSGLRPLEISSLEDYESVAHNILRAAAQGDTVSYQNWKLAQTVNWYLGKHPELTQRVAAHQASLIMICNGSQKQDSLIIPRGRGYAARPVFIP